jgi:hypothetical protein
MWWVHVAIRRTNAGRTRRRLLGGHGEGSAHATAGHIFRLSECEMTKKRQNDGKLRWSKSSQWNYVK